MRHPPTPTSDGLREEVLNLFCMGDRVVIRSRPRLPVKSGETASIDVGNEIPVITRTTDSDRQTEGTIDVLQEVGYRKTGAQLDIEPLVQANGLVTSRSPGRSARRGRPPTPASPDRRPS